MIRNRRLAAAAALFAAVAVPSAAQDFPTKPVTFVVPFAAGGPSDAIARLLGRAMEPSLRQPVLIDNTAGAGGTVGSAKVARAAPDGYTLLSHHISHATSVALYSKLPYRPVEDFAPIGLININYMALVAKKELPPKSMAELLPYIKANAAKLNYGDAGIGSASHLCGMLMMKALGVTLQSVSYKGTGPAMNDLVGGHVDLMCDQTTNSAPQIKAGTIKAYAVTSPARLGALPDLPTVAEAGLSGMEVGVWNGLYAPRGTPQGAIDVLVKALQQGLKDPAVAARMADLGTEPVATDQATPAALQKMLSGEIARWTPIIQAAGVKAD
jgi:tripartite-type tricarboxylate transporter receptor subunit TctC